MFMVKMTLNDPSTFNIFIGYSRTGFIDYLTQQSSQRQK